MRSAERSGRPTRQTKEDDRGLPMAGDRSMAPSRSSRAIRSGATCSSSTNISTATPARDSGHRTRPVGPAWSHGCCAATVCWTATEHVIRPRWPRAVRRQPPRSGDPFQRRGELSARLASGRTLSRVGSLFADRLLRCWYDSADSRISAVMAEYEPVGDRWEPARLPPIGRRLRLTGPRPGSARRGPGQAPRRRHLRRCR